jgi:hypothetical protein
VRRALTWLVALPVMVVGSQVAHGLAYWWAYPLTDLRAAVLAHSGHGYMAYAPVAVGFLLAVELVAMAVAVVDRVRDRPARGLPPWAFILMPAIGFTLQEHLERLFAIGVFPWWAMQEPSFWRGLVLQLPLGLLAYLIARLLLRTASVVAEVIRARRGDGLVVRRCPGGRRRSGVVLLRRLAPLAGAAAGRAPPLPVRL